MLYLTNYPHHFENSNNRIHPRWHYAVEGSREIALYLARPLFIVGYVCSSVCLPIIGLIVAYVIIKSAPNVIKHAVIIISLYGAADALIRAGFGLVSLIFKIFVIAGLFFGVFFPTIGEKVKTINQEFHELVERSLFLSDGLKEEKEQDLKTLGLPSNSSKTEIEKKYRQLALQYHPDKNPSPEAVARFHEISEAYQRLVGLADRAE